MAYKDRAKRKREKPKESAKELSMTQMYKKGGKAKKKSKFPDHSGDGKINR